MAKDGAAVRRRQVVDALLAKHGCSDFKGIRPKRIVVALWVRMKCMYGCKGYGRTATADRKISVDYFPGIM